MSATERRASIQNMSLACPDGWKDASMLIVTSETSSESGVIPNLVITRAPLSDVLPPGQIDRLQEFVDQQLDAMKDSLADFEAVAQRRVTAERPTAAITINWTSNGTPVTQAITYAYADEKTVVISTASASRKEFPDMEAQFLKLLQSFRIS